MELHERHKAQARVVTAAGQQQLYDAHVLIVGLGALGSVAAELLCRAGVRNITLCDYDIIEEHNLQRQSLYDSLDVGKPKVEAAKEHLLAIDPMCIVTVHQEPFKPSTDLTQFTVIIDGTDSLETRMLINDAAKKAHVPLVIGTASGTSGFVFESWEGACWQCVTLGKHAADDCDAGVLNMTTHAVASLQAAIALQAILDIHTEELLEINVWSHELRKFAVKRNAACNACKGEFVYLEAKMAMRFCGKREKLVATPNVPHTIDIDALRQHHEVLKDYGTATLFRLGKGTALVFAHGAMEFTNVDEDAAKRFAADAMK